MRRSASGDLPNHPGPTGRRSVRRQSQPADPDGRSCRCLWRRFYPELVKASRGVTPPAQTAGRPTWSAARGPPRRTMVASRYDSSPSAANACRISTGPVSPPLSSRPASQGVAPGQLRPEMPQRTRRYDQPRDRLRRHQPFAPAPRRRPARGPEHPQIRHQPARCRGSPKVNARHRPRKRLTPKRDPRHLCRKQTQSCRCGTTGLSLNGPGQTVGQVDGLVTQPHHIRLVATAS